LNEATKDLQEHLYASAHYLNKLLGRENPQDMIFILTTLFALALCSLMPYIRNPLVRKLYSTAGGISLGFYFMGAQLLLMFVQILGSFLLLKILPVRVGTILAPLFGGLCLLLRQIFEYSYGWEFVGLKSLMMQ
jgi:hypothetical protein